MMMMQYYRIMGVFLCLRLFRHLQSYFIIFLQAGVLFTI